MSLKFKYDYILNNTVFFIELTDKSILIFFDIAVCRAERQEASDSQSTVSGTSTWF